MIYNRCYLNAFFDIFFNTKMFLIAKFDKNFAAILWFYIFKKKLISQFSPTTWFEYVNIRLKTYAIL